MSPLIKMCQLTIHQKKKMLRMVIWHIFWKVKNFSDIKILSPLLKLRYFCETANYMLGPRVLSHGRSGNWKVWHHVTKGLVILGWTPFWTSILLLSYWVFANYFFDTYFMLSYLLTLDFHINSTSDCITIRGKSPKINKWSEEF